MELQQAAPAGVRVNFYIWQQTNFDKKHPDQRATHLTYTYSIAHPSAFALRPLLSELQALLA
jgi:hypothetical protein